MNSIDAKTIELAREVARRQVRRMTEPEPEPSPRRTEWMFDVEVKRKHILDGKVSWQFTVKPVLEVKKGEEYRCQFCHGAVRLHQGPKVQWHAEHIEREDAERCPGSPIGKANSTPARN